MDALVPSYPKIHDDVGIRIIYSEAHSPISKFQIEFSTIILYTAL